MNYYQCDGDATQILKTGRVQWITGIITGAITAAAAASSTYAINQAKEGRYPWDDPLDYAGNFMKASAIGGAAGALTGGAGGALGAALGSAAGGTAGGAAGGAASGGTGGGVASGSVAAASGAADGLPSIITPAVAQAASATPGQAAGGAVPSFGTAVGQLGGSIADAGGNQIGTALANETTQAITPAISHAPSMAARAADIGGRALVNAVADTAKSGIQGDRDFGRTFGTSLAGGLASGAVGSMTRGLSSDFDGRLEAPTNPDAVAQKSLLDQGRDKLLSTVPKIAGGATSNLVSRALAPAPMQPPGPDRPGLYAPPMNAGMGGMPGPGGMGARPGMGGPVPLPLPGLGNLGGPGFGVGRYGQRPFGSDVAAGNRYGASTW